MGTERTETNETSGDRRSHGSRPEHLQLVQSRIVTDDVAGMARYYAALIGAHVVVNDYYVEVPTAAQRVALVRMRFSDVEAGSCSPPAGVGVGALGADWLMGPTLQPWGRRSMMLRDPEGHLINVFEHKEDES